MLILITYISLTITIMLSGLLTIYGIKVAMLRMQRYKIYRLLKKPKKNGHEMSKLVSLIEKEENCSIC